MKFSRYNILVEKDNKVVLYNSKTAKYVKIFKEEEYSHFKQLPSDNLDVNDKMVNLLYQHGYVVDDNTDEFLEAQKSVNNIYQDYNRSFNILIYTTDQCNFRCAYCPEEHLDNRFSETKWNSLYKYIENNILNNNMDKLAIYFFGGEPLLEIKMIMTFLRKIRCLIDKYPQIETFFQFTTNGYLLTPKVYDDLLSLNFSYVFHITVDGFAESHDKTRPRVDGKGTWHKIIENIKYIDKQSDNTEIILRQNMNPTNKDNYIEFFDWIDKTFKSGKIVYQGIAVGARSEIVDTSYLMEHETDIVDDMISKLTKFKNELSNVHEPLQKVGYACICARRNAFSISTDGQIYKCFDSYNKRFANSVGYLNDVGEIVYTTDINKIEEYEIPECSTCKIYPLCAGRSCPGEKIADDVARYDCKYKGKFVEERVKQYIFDTKFD